MAITRAQQARQMLKEGTKKPVKQAGATNYLGKQEMVTAPKFWLSEPDHVKAKLAYITDEEEQILIDKNLYGSLKGKPNIGPAGLPSLQGGDFGSEDKGSDNQSGGGGGNGGSDARESYIRDYVSKGKVKGGGKAIGTDKGTGGPTVYEDRDFRNRKNRQIIERQRRNYEKQFFDRGQVPPLGGRPTSLGTKLNQRNLQKRLNYINTLQSNLRKKLNTGLIDYQTEFGPFTNVADFSTLDDYIDEVQSVQDLVDKGFYSKDGRFAKGDIPDFTTKTGIPSADILGEIFGGPITSDKLKDLQGQISDLENLKTSEGLASTTFDDLMEKYQPNRFKLQNPGPDDDGPDPILPIIPKMDDTEEDTTPDRNLAGLSPRIGGSIFDFTGLADGGRVAAAEGGIMELARQEMFLGGIAKGIKKAVKGVSRAVKKVAKSPIGKVALLAAGAGYGGFGPLKGLFSGVKGAGFLKSMAVNKSLLGTSDYMGGPTGILDFIKANPFKTIGGISLLSGLMTPKQDDDEFDLASYYASQQLTPSQSVRGVGSEMDFYNYNLPVTAADGGRIGLSNGGISFREYLSKQGLDLDKLDLNTLSIMQRAYDRDIPNRPNKLADGGKPEPVAKETMPLLDMGGKEMDLREEGGFVPIGRMEKADDVPARLSKNEFVFTADAVRNAGDGDVDKGAEVMYNMMKNLESGGDVSEESQGLEGAREMFQTSKRLEEVL